MRRPWLSIPTRIFLGFAILCAMLVALGTASLLQHEATGRSLRRLHEGYLPLALTIGEAKANQAVFVTLLGEMLGKPGTSLEHEWLGIARRMRPATLRRALHGAHRVARLAETAEERRVALRMIETLEQIDARFATSSAAVDRVLEAMRQGDSRTAGEQLAFARGLELDVQRRLRDLHLLLEDRAATLARDAADDEARAAVYIGGLTTAGLLLGMAVTWLSVRLLAPMQLLHARVGAVGRGDFSNPLRPVRSDELGRLTEEFERMVEALANRDRTLREAERLAAIGRMAAHVTHEVRNPLSSIALNVEMLGDELPPDSAEARSLLVAIHREIDRLTAITEDYLRLARVPSPRLEPVDLAELVEEIVRFVRPEMERAQVQVGAVLGDERPTLLLDEAQMRQALLNLLRNAREAMPEGGPIRVTLRAFPDAIELGIADRGVGMTDEQRSRLFDPFFSTKMGGTGLGLPLTQQIVAAHGGTIRCEPHEGGGTVFVVRLPISDTSDKPSAS